MSSTFVVSTVNHHNTTTDTTTTGISSASAIPVPVVPVVPVVVGQSGSDTTDRRISQQQQQVQQQLPLQQRMEPTRSMYNNNSMNTTGSSTASTSAPTSLQDVLGGQPSTMTTTTTATTNSNHEISGMIRSKTVPFSEDLIRILKEVAIKGSSSVVPWKLEDDTVIWKRPERRTTLSVAAAVVANRASHPPPPPHQHHHHHDYYATGPTRLSRSSGSTGSSSHKRTRMSTMSSRHLHSSHRSSSSTSSTTTTMVMVQQPSPSSQSTGPMTSNLFVLRPQPASSSTSSAATTTYQNSLFLPNASTGRTTTTTASITSYTAASGSEHEDTSQYECDSEGTSATSNSEMSFSSSISKRRGMSTMGNIGSRANLSLTIAKRNDPIVRPQYASVRDALLSALTLVLDYYYNNRGGYKLSPLEQRIYDVGSETNPTSQNVGVVHRQDDTISNAETFRNSEDVFQKRKKRLLEMMSRYCSTTAAADIESSDIDRGPTIISHGNGNSRHVKSASPPFTIQRLAEVLMEPERYYSQTHKLCNCIEKLLLVTSSASAFGGSIGGGTTQSRQEETEIAALSEERKRLRSEFRQRHKKSRRSSHSGVTRTNERGIKIKTDIVNDKNATKIGDPTRTGIPDADADDDDDELLPAAPNTPTELLDAAARATLRSKFDHVGIDPHSQAAMANSRDVMAMMESRRLNNTSPPPPPLSHNNGLQPQYIPVSYHH